MKSPLLCFAVLLISSFVTHRSVDDAVYQIPDGFELEEIYSPTKDSLGTWVAIVETLPGTFICSDQHGGLYQVSYGHGREAVVEELDLGIGMAQGLLWAFDALYIVVNSDEGISGNNSGLYRAKDSNGDGKLDHLKPLIKLEGSGEHGPHSIILSPDNNSLYLVAGNHTEMPEGFTKQSFPGEWHNDSLFPPILDPRGHAVHTKAPGGWIAKTDPDGKSWEIISVGMRNTYDIAFNNSGDLFAFDSDMEWDMGMPWYRPIRVLHATAGSEFGWRPGSQKWPEYYPDSLPSILTLNQGSPTGILFGYGADFPQSFQESLFVLDWSFGTMYQVQLELKGSSYKAKAKEFISGTPFPLTDAIIGSDGSMYILTGGRQLESKLFRLSYTGNEDTRPLPISSLSSESEDHILRRQAEAYLSDDNIDSTSANYETVQESKSELYLELLSNKDRHVRFSARKNLESLGAKTLSNLDYSELGLEEISELIISMASTADSSLQELVFEILLKHDLSKLSEEAVLSYTRAVSLSLMKLGDPFPQISKTLADKLNELLPSDSDFVNREIVALLSYLNDSRIIDYALEKLETVDTTGLFSNALLDSSVTARRERYGTNIEDIRSNPPSANQISYSYSLSHHLGDWSLDQRERFFTWFYGAMNKTGGSSYKGFIDEIRQRALSNMSESQRKEIAHISSDIEQLSLNAFSNLPRPEGPGKNWNVAEIEKDLDDRLELKRNYNRGKKMYKAALCETCHLMGTEGGLVGPSLSQVSGKFGSTDLIRAIILPSQTIADQYGATVVYAKGEDITMGRIVLDEVDRILINTNPFDTDQSIEIRKSDIASSENSAISTMPPGLLDRLNLEEVTDLVAYLLANGDSEHEYFSDREIN